MTSAADRPVAVAGALPVTASAHAAPGPPPPGLYVHVPFCAAICGYCDFNRYADLDHLMPAYTRALLTDLQQVAAAGPRALAPAGSGTATQWPPFGSVFVGGGTPTRLPAAHLGALLRAIPDVLPLRSDAEVTVEANPETVTRPLMAALAGAGVTRVSMGAQSFAPHVLEALGRWHDPDRPLQAVADCRAAGIARVSLDLIYGSPVETDADWRRTLDLAVGSGAEHLSAYALTVEANTVYAGRIRAGAASPPDPDVQAGRMETADTVLAAAGLDRYEISNWARPGHACRHNLTYWRGGDWVGVGAGAHAHWQGRRSWRTRAPGRYIQALDNGGSPVAGHEDPDPAQRRFERLLLGLRLAEGVERAAVEPVDERAAAALVAHGLLDDDGGRLRLTAAGWPVASDVIVRLSPPRGSRASRASAAPRASAGAG